jgi:chromosome segregation protein
MYLKKLSLQGFKSFANRTTFDFGRGVTAVVGPNGSGKSNVADAIRWVLGEQSARLLRAKKQEDVIFAGAGQRSPVGMAEVILTLDNEDRWLPVDFAEVEVGRRVYRNGESEYLLNGARVRLRDVVDLLMKGDVGQNSYAIMGQGLVDEVLSMSPDERRTFLDEAADVKRFRARIREAQERLAATRENMERVQLLVGEIEPRLAQLSRQAERASEHRRLAGELAELLQVYYDQRWSEAQNSLVRSRALLDQRVAEDAAAGARVHQLREQIRALGEEIRKRREAIGRREEGRRQLEQRTRSLEQAIALDRERRAMLASRGKELAGEVEALEAEQAALSSTEAPGSQDEQQVAEGLEAARAQAARCRDELDSAEREYSALRSRLRELREAAEAEDRRARSARAEIDSSLRHAEALDRDLEAAATRRKQLLADLAAYGRAFAELRARVRSAQAGLDAARNAADAARTRLAAVEQELRDYEAAMSEDVRELDRLEGRLDTLRRIQAEHEGVAAGTRNALIMGQALTEGIAPDARLEGAEVPGVLGMLARKIRVPAGLETAINAALEYRLHAVVVEHAGQALKLAELLAERGHGRAQFLPLDTVHHVHPLNLNRERGVLGVASALVRCEAPYRRLVDTLLGRVIVVEDIDTALTMIQRSLGSVVTLDGTLLEQNGIISGGATGARETGFSRQRELEELPREIAALREQAGVSHEYRANGHRMVETLAARAQEADRECESRRRALDAARGELEKARDRLHGLRRQMDAARAKLAEVERESAATTGRTTRARATLEESQAAGQERQSALASVEAQLRAATERREAALRGVTEAGSLLAGAEGERRAFEAIRRQQQQAADRVAGQLATRRNQAVALEREAATVDERLRAAEAELQSLQAEPAGEADDAEPDRDELLRLEKHERQVQDELAGAQEGSMRAQRARLEAEAGVSRAAEHIEALRVEMERERLVPGPTGAIVPADQAGEAGALAGGQPGAPTVQGAALIDVEETGHRIEELRRRIRRLGPINEEAPEDYRESQERYEFLTGQVRDLEEAEVQLRGAIAELNEEIRARFGATFDAVNTSFGQYFASFFGGGQARLLLTNPQEVAESGIEIEAQPPGKRLSHLNLLSGGERSLTAVALLFALLSANPAPFCVLDEVDAALDEANVGRFTAALRELAERTQFLVVTHNRRTVETADAIYGVSMGAEGVSKVLSLRLSELTQN